MRRGTYFQPALWGAREDLLARFQERSGTPPGRHLIWRRFDHDAKPVPLSVGDWRLLFGENSQPLLRAHLPCPPFCKALRRCLCDDVRQRSVKRWSQTEALKFST